MCATIIGTPRKYYEQNVTVPKITYGGGGGSVMLWSCLSSKSPGNLVRVHGIINSMKYQDILNLNLAAPSRKLKLGRRWIFQQDSDPKHTCKSTQK